MARGSAEAVSGQRVIEGPVTLIEEDESQACEVKMQPNSTAIVAMRRSVCLTIVRFRVDRVRVVNTVATAPAARRATLSSSSR
jgi:hypothetical protein